LALFVHPLEFESLQLLDMITTTDSVITAGFITAGIRRTGSDDLSLPVLGSENQKMIGGVTHWQ
jgi:hypothetical protein